MTFGQALRRARLKAGLTMRELGDAMGISHAYVSYVEHGRNPPFGQRLMSAAESALGCNLAKYAECPRCGRRGR